MGGHSGDEAANERGNVTDRGQRYHGGRDYHGHGEQPGGYGHTVTRARGTCKGILDRWQGSPAGT